VQSGYRETTKGIEVHFYYLLDKLISFLRGSMYRCYHPGRAFFFSLRHAMDDIFGLVFLFSTIL
jgi:hypothetical protein